jgi:septal ring factor EnvC (AmiA/AmiB activator)
MNLDIHFFKKDVDFRKIRKDIDNLQEKLRVIQDEVEQLEDDYEDARLSSFNITHNLHTMAKEVGGSYEDFVRFCKSVLQKCREYPDAVVEATG